MSTALGHPRQSAGNVRTDRHRTFDAELHRTCGEMRSESPRILKRWPREANESPLHVHSCPNQTAYLGGKSDCSKIDLTGVRNGLRPQRLMASSSGRLRDNVGLR